MQLLEENENKYNHYVIILNRSSIVRYQKSKAVLVKNIINDLIQI